MSQRIRRKFTAEMINMMREDINKFFESNKLPIRVQSLAVRHIANTLRVHLSVSELMIYKIIEQNFYRFIGDCLHYDRDQYTLKVTVEDASLLAKQPDANQWEKALDELRSLKPDEVNEADLNLLNRFISRAAEKAQVDEGLRKHITDIIKRIFWSKEAQVFFAFLLEGFEGRDAFEHYAVVYEHLSHRGHLQYFSEELVEIEKDCLDVDKQDDLKQFYIQAINKLENGIKSLNQLKESLSLYLGGLESTEKLGRYLFKFSKLLLQQPAQLKWLVVDDFRLDLILNQEKLTSFAENKKTFNQRRVTANALLIDVQTRQALLQQKLQDIKEIYISLVSQDRDLRRHEFFSYCKDDKLHYLYEAIKLLEHKTEATVASSSVAAAFMPEPAAVEDHVYDNHDLEVTPSLAINPSQLFSTSSQSLEIARDVEKLKEPEPEPEPEPELELEKVRVKEKKNNKPKINSKNKNLNIEKNSHKESETEVDASRLALSYRLKQSQAWIEMPFHGEKSKHFDDGRACYPLSEFILVLVIPEILDLDESLHQLLENNVGRGLLTTVGFGRSGVKSFKDYAIIKTREETRIVCARCELYDTKHTMRTVFIPVKAIDSHETYTRKLRDDTLAGEANTCLKAKLCELHVIEPALRSTRVCRS
jgi:hypothetical protein